MIALEPDCLCGDPQLQHRRGTGGCREVDCGCGRYVPTHEGSSSGLDVAALLGEVQGDVSREAELAARLADVERELDASREQRDELSESLDRVSLENVALRKDLERVEQHEEIRAQVIRERNDELAALRIELAGAVRKGGHAVAESAGQQARIRELRAEVDTLTAQLEQAEHYARDLQERGIEPAGERLYDTHVRYLCPVCGARYREFHNHPCGRLVPVRVRITFIEE